MEKTEQQNVGKVEDSYLNLNLQEVAKKLGRPLVIANYVCDLNDVIADKSSDGVALGLKNDPDWQRFQELTAQADAIITGTGYLKRFAANGDQAENVLNQFSKGSKFAELGDWRENKKLKREPDLLIVSRSLNFDIPQEAFVDSRKVYVFTTSNMAASKEARKLLDKGVRVVGFGKSGRDENGELVKDVSVDGKMMIEYLTANEKYNVIKNTTGPRVLALLLEGDVLDELYITRVQREIEGNPNDIQTILKKGKIDDLEGFTYEHLLHQDNVRAKDGVIISQDLGVYKKKNVGL